jgi:hypothetical protein
VRCLRGLATNRWGAEREEQEEIAAGDADCGSGAAAAWSGAVITWLPERARRACARAHADKEKRRARDLREGAEGIRIGRAAQAASRCAPPVALSPVSRPSNLRGHGSWTGACARGHAGDVSESGPSSACSVPPRKCYSPQARLPLLAEFRVMPIHAIVGARASHSDQHKACAGVSFVTLGSRSSDMDG